MSERIELEQAQAVIARMKARAEAAEKALADVRALADSALPNPFGGDRWVDVDEIRAAIGGTTVDYSVTCPGCGWHTNDHRLEGHVCRTPLGDTQPGDPS